jgi:hypothetical protein
MTKKSKAVAEEAAAWSPRGSAQGSKGGGEKRGSFLLGQPTREDVRGGDRARAAGAGEGGLRMVPYLPLRAHRQLRRAQETATQRIQFPP